MLTAVTAYTPAYEQYLDSLVSDCSTVDLPLVSYPLPDLGSWMANVHQKAHSIHRALRTLQHPVLWLDVDSHLTAPPPAQDEHVDFAARLITPPSPRIYDFLLHETVDNRAQVCTPAGGTMYFGYSLTVLTLVEHWVGVLALYPDVNDEQCLRHSLNRHRNMCTAHMEWTPWYTSTWAGYQHGKPPKGGVV
jgi:hypothetical protein